MPKARKNRTNLLVRRWKVALANAGLKQAEWAAQHGWSENHVGQTVAGKRESVHVLNAVLPFIAAQERLIADRSRSAVV